MPSRRTQKSIDAYKKVRDTASEQTYSFFSDAPAITEYKYWRLLKNNFPYDAIASKHYLLTPRRVFTYDSEMTSPEREELYIIKRQLAKTFDSILENFTQRRTIKEHFHLHLLNFK